MTGLTRFILITFLESIAAVLAERGVYFATHQRLGYSDWQNLLLACSLAVPYIFGALASHRLSRRLSEKSLLMATVAGQAAVFVAIISYPTDAPGFGVAIAVAMGIIGLLNGLKWPVLESYVSAGRDPSATSRAIGIFNVSWSVAVPIALALTGPLIRTSDVPALDKHPLVFLFGFAAVVNMVSLALCRPIGRSPTHLAHDHPSRVSAETTRRYATLLVSSRWSMLGSYAMLFLISPLMPGILAGLGVGETVAPALSGLIDWVRTATFVFMQLTVFWHGRASLVVAVVLGMPAGFLMILFGPAIPIVVGGMVIFGVLSGLAYFSSLYYGLVIKNASVDAGGAHEGLIGLGFFAGPAAGLVAEWLTAGPFSTMGATAKIAATATGVGPLVVVCALGGLWPLLRCTATKTP